MGISKGQIMEKEWSEFLESSNEFPGRPGLYLLIKDDDLRLVEIFTKFRWHGTEKLTPTEDNEFWVNYGSHAEPLSQVKGKWLWVLIRKEKR